MLIITQLNRAVRLMTPSFNTRPYEHLKDGNKLAFERLKRQLGGKVTDEVVRKLMAQTFLQSNANSQVVIRRDTGERFVTATAAEVEQSVIGRKMNNSRWHENLLAVPHPVYAPNRPMWLRNGDTLFRNTWRQSPLSASIPDWNEAKGDVARPMQWEAFLFRLFYSDLWNDIRDKDADKIKREYPDHIRFIHEFELWLAFSLFSDERPRWAPVLRGDYGTGKGTLEAHVIQPFVGSTNFVKVMAKNIKGDHGAQFLVEKCMVVFDEVNDRGHVFYDTLKNLTTEDQLAVNPKHLAPYVDHAVFSTLILSNEEAPMAWPEAERRWLVSPYMRHEDSQEETASFLYDWFVPWFQRGGYKELGLFLKYLAATQELPAVAWKSPWFFEASKVDRTEDQKAVILSWLDSQDDMHGYTPTALAEMFKVKVNLAKQCLEERGYGRGKAKGTNINVYKKKGEVGNLHPLLTP